jgi:hypothetical protein
MNMRESRDNRRPGLRFRSAGGGAIVLAAMTCLFWSAPAPSVESGIDVLSNVDFTYVYLDVIKSRVGNHFPYPSAEDVGRFVAEMNRQQMFPRVRSALFGIPTDVDPRRGVNVLDPDVAALPEQITWRLGFEIAADAPLDAPLAKASYTWPQVVRVQRTGPYETIHLAFDQLGPFVEEEGLVIAGPLLVRWIDDPAQTPPEKRRYEILAPVNKADRQPSKER